MPPSISERSLLFLKKTWCICSQDKSTNIGSYIDLYYMFNKIELIEYKVIIFKKLTPLPLWCRGLPKPQIPPTPLSGLDSLGLALPPLGAILEGRFQISPKQSLQIDLPTCPPIIFR